jgi:CRP-like cAMP-binding protein/HAMP domain-containing protein
MAEIKKLLPTVVVLQIFVAMGVTSWLSFVSARKEVEQLVNKIIVQESNLTKYKVTKYLSVPKFFQKMNQIAIANGNLNVENFPNLERYFWRQVQLGQTSASDGAASGEEKGISYIFYGNARGDFLGVERQEDGKSLMRIRTQETAPQRVFYELDAQGKRSPEIRRQEYDPRDRPWYQAAQGKRGLLWSPIYAASSDGSLGINSVLPIYDNGGALRGVMAVDVSLTQISEFLSGLKTNQMSKAFIIDGSGKLVGTSVDEPLSTQDNQQVLATQSLDPMIQETAKKLLSDYKILQNPPQPEPFSLEIEGDRLFVQVSTLQELELDWRIILMIPEAVFMDQIYANVRRTLLLGFAALGGAVAVCLITSRWIVKPIALLDRAAQEIQAEEFNPETLVGTIKRDDELGQLARVFQEMAVKIYNREKGMKKQMDQLRLEQEQASVASKLATINQKSSLQDLLKQSKTLRIKEKTRPNFNLSYLLKKVKYFQSFSEADIQEMIKIGYQKQLPEASYVCREDEPGDALYLILTGTVEMYVEKINKFLANLSDGTFFGELSLLLGIPQTATVRTTTDTLLFVVDRHGLQTLLQRDRELADEIAIELHQHLDEHQGELDERQEMFKNWGLIAEDDNSFNDTLRLIRNRITTIFEV